MSAAPMPQPVLSRSEWELVVELLERERGDLPAEIRHTRTSNIREELRQRLKTVEGLLEKLRPFAGA